MWLRKSIFIKMDVVFKFIPGSSEVIWNGDVVERHVTSGWWNVLTLLSPSCRLLISSSMHVFSLLVCFVNVILVPC